MQDDGNSELLGNLVQSLMDSAEHPPTQVEVCVPVDGQEG
jgi:hypothetical protein